MRQLKQKPPKYIWKGVHRIFDLRGTEPAFAYGDVIYNPFGNRAYLHQTYERFFKL